MIVLQSYGSQHPSELCGMQDEVPYIGVIDAHYTFERPTPIRLVERCVDMKSHRSRLPSRNIMIKRILQPTQIRLRRRMFHPVDSALPWA